MYSSVCGKAIPAVRNNLIPGTHFPWRMEAKDGSIGFDFSGIFEQVNPCKHIEYTLDDNRKVISNFTYCGPTTREIEIFEAENTNPMELQKKGWQSILNNFRKYAETGS